MPPPGGGPPPAPPGAAGQPQLPGNPPSYGNQLPNPGNVAWQQSWQREAMAQHQQMRALQNHTQHPVAPIDDPIDVD